MTVADFIKQFMKADASVDLIWEKAQGLATEYGIDLEKLDEANAQFLAGEIDNIVGGGLAVPEGGAIAPVEEKSGKKKGKGAIQPSASKSVDALKPAVKNLRDSVAGEAEAIVSVFDQKASAVEDATTNRIMARCRAISPNIIEKVSQGLQEYTNESESFRQGVGSVFDETFADLINFTSI